MQSLKHTTLVKSLKTHPVFAIQDVLDLGSHVIIGLFSNGPVSQFFELLNWFDLFCSQICNVVAGRYLVNPNDSLPLIVFNIKLNPSVVIRLGGLVVTC